jgi:hypothetical protein
MLDVRIVKHYLHIYLKQTFHKWGDVMIGLQFPLPAAGAGGQQPSQAAVSRVAAERHALLLAARHRRMALAAERRPSIRHRHRLSGILFRLSSRATTLV